MKKIIVLSTLLCLSHSAFAGEWDYPLAKTTIATKESAELYLSSLYPDVGTLKFRYQTESLLGNHYNFDVWQNGQYQPQKALVLSTDQSGVVTRVFKSLHNTVERDGVALVAAELESPRRLVANEPPSLSSGDVQSINVQLFDPDLRTMDQLPAPDSAWNDLADYPNQPHYQSVNVEMLQSAGKYYLANERVRQVDATAIQQQDDAKQWVDSGVGLLSAEDVAQWNSDAEILSMEMLDDRFVQLMAFYHLDQSIDYTKQLGFSLFSEPVRFDARGLSSNNSSYYVGPKALLFGVGGSPDALDADVVTHELGHGIHYQIVPDWAYGHSGAIGEGFGDYWAGSHSFRRQYAQGKAFEIDTVFNWDGYFGTRISTRSLWNQRAKYFASAEYRAHESVAGELGDELWSTPLFQALKQAVNEYGQEAFAEFDRIVLESMYGLGRGLKMHDLSESMLYTAKQLYPHRAYDAMLLQQFKQHNLVQEPFKFLLERRFVMPTDPLNVHIQATDRQASLQTVATLQGEAVTFASEKFQQQQWSIALPTTYTCGVKQTLQLESSYQYQPYLAMQSDKQTLSFIVGKPQLATPPVAINSVLKDASIDGTDTVTSGFKSYGLTLDVGNALIDEDFVVRLQLSHPELQELRVTLISPAGTRVELLNQAPSAINGFDDYWVLAHDAILGSLQGEALSGYWRLEVIDYNPGNSGTLIEWGVGRLAGYQCPQPVTNALSPETGGGSTSLLLLLPLAAFAMRRRNLLAIFSLKLKNT
ncbi:proprotein convertase P-domain-containing protein [Vibrio sp. RM-69-4]|uniref:proprotein convertase P-domain-containing protein n=1 Tax=Vibrio sp. RM-69-4 TaxID=2950157 RepID=UPI00215CA4D1|nr:proprotein convertase P-domain-containing protein [Vibrio sp. RM-69-4]MCR9422371.1 proprotein convertase P-domain-containing protein [Vibrio sp. RM-69-4]